jgi:hypothetical protein
VTIPQLQ